MSKAANRKGVCAEERIRAIHLAAQAAGTTCLETQWLGSDGRHRYRCKHGHEWTQRGHLCIKRPHCPKCGHAALYKRENLSLMHEAARARGGECLSDEYLGLAARYRFRCKLGHEWMAEGKTMLKKGTWCGACSREASKRAELPRPYRSLAAWGLERLDCRSPQQRLDLCKDSTLERMKAWAQGHGGSCLSEQYTGAGRYRFRCARGHEWSASSKRVFAGVWCRQCEQEAWRVRSPATRSASPALQKSAGGAQERRAARASESCHCQGCEVGGEEPGLQRTLAQSEESSTAAGSNPRTSRTCGAVTN